MKRRNASKLRLSGHADTRTLYQNGILADNGTPEGKWRPCRHSRAHTKRRNALKLRSGSCGHARARSHDAAMRNNYDLAAADRRVPKPTTPKCGITTTRPLADTRAPVRRNAEKLRTSGLADICALLSYAA